jgi:uncharacterized caspase-like protein
VDGSRQLRQLLFLWPIVTNSSYNVNVLSRLESTHGDGELLARTLKKVGFDVVYKEDLNYQQMRRELVNFNKQLRMAGPDVVPFFYFSGHGAADGSPSIISNKATG